MNAPEHVRTTKPAFVWEDPLLLDDQLSEDERMVRDTAHDYAQEKLLPRVTEAFRYETSDPSVFPEMGALGLLGATVPPEYGGALHQLAARAHKTQAVREGQGLGGGEGR